MINYKLVALRTNCIHYFDQGEVVSYLMTESEEVLLKSLNPFCSNPPTPSQSLQPRFPSFLLKLGMINFWVVAEFIDPDWGDNVNSGIGLSYQPARQATWASGPVRQPYAGVDFIPQSGTKNSDIGIV
jgi:hypothetical protein